MCDKKIGYVSNGVYSIEKDGFAFGVPAFAGGKTEGVFSGGDNCFIVCINDAEYSNVTHYAELLEANGYTKVFKNNIGDNVFYSYKNKENLIFFYFLATNRSVRVMAEPFYSFSYNEPFEDIVSPAVITSSACDRNYYILLPNNKLVVIDGGWRIEDWSRFKAEELLFEMYKEMAEIVECEQVSIPLWIITHAHNDHARVLELLHKMPFADKFKIDRILYNFPDDDHIKEQTQVADELFKESENNFSRWHKNAGKDYPYEDIFYNCPFPVYETIGYENTCREAFKKYGAVNIKAHDGMRFDMSGVVFEVLHTPDDDMPTIYKNMNDTSLVIKMTYKGSATLWLGDMGVIPGNSCIEMYGDYLKCDAVQVSHHGWGSASWEFFKLLNPSLLLWNNSEFGFQYADKRQGYGKTESSTRLFNMPCVKKNYFCNTIKMQYIPLPFDFSDDNDNTADCKLLVSAASDQTFMVRLDDGKLIMINGGWRKEMWERYDNNKLLGNLFCEMQQLAGTEKITIAAWFVTDADNNNNQFLANLKNTDFADKITIENIVYNFPKNYSELPLAKCIKSLNGHHIIAKTGQRMNFGDAEVKILYAPNEDNFDSINDASVVFMLELNKEKILFTGNMTDRISKVILSNDEDIQCSIVQIANHGHNNCGILDFYSRCNAQIQIWNTSEYAYRFFSPDEGYEKSQVSTSVYNFEHCRKNYFCDRILPEVIGLPIKSPN